MSVLDKRFGVTGILAFAGRSAQSERRAIKENPSGRARKTRGKAEASIANSNISFGRRCAKVATFFATGVRPDSPQHVT